MILNDGEFNGKHILSKASVDLLYTPQVENKRISLNNEIRTIGWIMGGITHLVEISQAKYTTIPAIPEQVYLSIAIIK